MKTNKISACQQFNRDIQSSMAKYYSQQLLERIKRGLALKKMSTAPRCNVKNSKV